MQMILSLANLGGRIFIAAIFILSGLAKIGGYAGTQGYMESMGVPGALLPVVIALEVVGGIAIVVGWHTRIVAFLLAGFTLLSALVFHSNLGDQTQYYMFMKNVAIAGGFLFLVANGGGVLSLDHRRASALSTTQLVSTGVPG